MNKTSKIIAGIFALSMLVTPALAAQCDVTLKNVQDQFSSSPDVVEEKLSDIAVSELVSRLGVPPGIKNGSYPEDSFEIYFYHNEHQGILYIVQDGCVRNTVGPGLNEQINHFLGRQGV